MNKYGFTFNGVRKDYVVTLRGKKRPPWAPLERGLIEVPGMPGAHPGDTKVKPRKLSIPILIESKNLKELKPMSEDLADWLVTEEPAELIFDDEPNRTYFAYVDETLDIDEIIRVGAGILTFICPDPYKYGKQDSATFKDVGSLSIGGSAPTFPITKVKIKKDTTFVSIGNGDKINMIGNPAEVTQQPIAPMDQMVWNHGDNLIGWANTLTVDGIANAGVLKAGGSRFSADDYGAGASYHGPAMKTSLSTPIQDFTAEAWLHLSGGSGQAGMMEFSLLDVNNKIVCKFSIEKRSAYSSSNWMRIMAGTLTDGHDIMHYAGPSEGYWAGFDGVLRISRIGRKWTAYVSRITNGVLNSDYKLEWEDVSGKYTTPVAQVQLQLAQYGTIPVTTQSVDAIGVWRNNTPTGNQIPYVAKAGDYIEFDHQNDVIRRNSGQGWEIVNKDKAFIGEYFPLKKGANAIVVDPADSIESTEVRWRERWL